MKLQRAKAYLSRMFAYYTAVPQGTVIIYAGSSWPKYLATVRLLS